MMSLEELVLRGPQDHIMANTWRLIFEHKGQGLALTAVGKSIRDISGLTPLLPEYRIIGFTLADQNGHRRPN